MYFSTAHRPRKHLHPKGLFSSLRLRGYLALLPCSGHGRSFATPLRNVTNRILYFQSTACASRRSHRFSRLDLAVLQSPHHRNGNMKADVVTCHCCHLWHGSSTIPWLVVYRYRKIVKRPTWGAAKIDFANRDEEVHPPRASDHAFLPA